MPDYRRAYVPGGTYFFTLVAHDRRPFLTTDLARQCLRSAWNDVRKRQPFHMPAVCILPDHLHCIWALPDGDSDFSGRWRAIKGLFSMRYLAAGGTDGARSASRKKRGEAALWQRRFWEHLVRDEEDFRKHMDYIHFNPVKHGYASRPADWPWSSFRRCVAAGWYTEAWGAQEEPVTLRGFDGAGE